MLKKEIARTRKAGVKRLRMRKADRANEERFQTLEMHLADVCTQRLKLLRLVRRLRGILKKFIFLII